jgi:membrane protease YdiL (CAAX protease family)
VVSSLRSYANESGGILYSYLICVPLLLLYELLIIISQPDTNYLVRISVDVWFKSIFTLLGLNTISATLFIAALIGAYIVYKKRSSLKSIKKRYFGYMLLECFFYAVVISLAIGNFLSPILNFFTGTGLEGFNKLQLIALSLGAGLYEELFFRVILVGLLVLLFKKIFSKNYYAYGVSVIIAALLFSGVHYIGEFGDNWALGSFLFRFLFGLALNLIYVIRGFGMAAWTHAIYDLIVVLRI